MFSGLAGGSTSHSQLPAPTGKSLADSALCIALQRPATSPFCHLAALCWQFRCAEWGLRNFARVTDSQSPADWGPPPC